MFTILPGSGETSFVVGRSDSFDMFVILSVLVLSKLDFSCLSSA